MPAIRFLSNNPHKIAEAQRILQPVGIKVIAVNAKIDELQTEDIAKLVKDKAIKAIKAIQKLGKPLLV